MKVNIYTSDFRTGPTATEKQQMLFATDTAYAISKGYTHIQDSTGILFLMVDQHNLVEVETADELLNEPDEVELDTDECACDCGCEPDEDNAVQVAISEHTLTGDMSQDGPFFADVKTCFDSGVAIIQDAAGYGFTIVTATCVTGLYTPDSDEIDEELMEAPTKLSNIAAIRLIINNTLNQSKPIRGSQVRTLLDLAELHKILEGFNR